MSKATMSDISKILSNDKKSTDFHYYGTVESINEDGTYDVSINHTEDITVTAAKLVGAHVGDTVMVTVMSNGYATVTGCLGGDKDSAEAKEVAEEAKEIVEQSIQSDWDQHDKTISSYVLNKPPVTHGSHLEEDSWGNMEYTSTVEGNLTGNRASGRYSHSEGKSSYATAEAAHAEGIGANAEGEGAHSEGLYTEALGDASHAEGDSTSASGNASHAGGLYTKATGEAQTVIGKYNDVDDNALFIIGNGKEGFTPDREDSQLRNAFKVDDKGITYIRGDIYAGLRNNPYGRDLELDDCVVLTSFPYRALDALLPTTGLGYNDSAKCLYIKTKAPFGFSNGKLAIDISSPLFIDDGGSLCVDTDYLNSRYIQPMYRNDAGEVGIYIGNGLTTNNNQLEINSSTILNEVDEHLSNTFVSIDARLRALEAERK